MAREKVLLKDEFFNYETVSLLAKTVKQVYEPLNEKQFIDEVVSRFPMYELKERVHWISIMLKKYLPDSYIESVKILYKSISKIDFEGSFAFASYPDFVSTYGCTKEYLDLSLNMLGEFTKMFSAEFAIRFFINDFPLETYNKMYEWSLSDNYHQRRLASEGLRPKLPWAKGINIDYKKGIMPLNNLYYDDERYITRSVANHLNDVSKIDPLLVLTILSKWKVSKKQNEKEMEYIISHSLRTLVKKGHKETMEFLGYSYLPKISIHNLLISNPNINIGDSIKFNFIIEALEDEKLVVDYKVVYPMANNKKSSKVFKLKKLYIKKGDIVEISKKHAFRLMTTKKLYSGEYSLVIQINGKELDEVKFNLTV